eukprot:CAMPEP_0170645050 /NCGR_PEP_ID=MMETSP0224-20130122/42844_1 /TAXON_ID=285029 /ORGANISM="Togula jolla, Strain CCCM 725" /LENGTH=55 /DNA_ID=CAMNT_0010976183 /DNA_START=210 /DNA_END=377 /DNA_ORIENTATION=-
MAGSEAKSKILAMGLRHAQLATATKSFTTTWRPIESPEPILLSMVTNTARDLARR